MSGENIEIERKFLVSQLPSYINEMPHICIEQGFLNSDRRRVTRVRLTSDGEAFLTVKGVANGAMRVEIETPIDPGKARAMLAMVEGAVITKTRRKILYAGKIWELDIFEGANVGLVIAEIELDSEFEVFDVPPWIGKEVTEDQRYANSNLALMPYSLWVEKGAASEI